MSEINPADHKSLVRIQAYLIPDKHFKFSWSSLCQLCELVESESYNKRVQTDFSTTRDYTLNKLHCIVHHVSYMDPENTNDFFKRIWDYQAKYDVVICWIASCWMTKILQENSCKSCRNLLPLCIKLRPHCLTPPQRLVQQSPTPLRDLFLGLPVPFRIMILALAEPLLHLCRLQPTVSRSVEDGSQIFSVGSHAEAFWEAAQLIIFCQL